MGTYFTTTVHFIGNHLIELDPENPDRATGHVYCRAEHEQGDNWVIVMVHYSDKYRRDDGTWYFYSRRMTVTSVRKDPEALTMIVTAELDATVERSWQLWADPRQLERWWGPPTYPATVVDHDLTTGGRVTYYMTSSVSWP